MRAIFTRTIVESERKSNDVSAPSKVDSDALADESGSNAAKILSLAVRWLGALVVALLCLSGLQFCLYIALTYVVPLLGGELENWNANFLPGLYDADNRGATGSIGMHFITGVIVMVLGCVQLLPALRTHWPQFHRWIGRLYVGLAALTACGGLGFILLQGTVGGAVMNIGFGLYGILMIIAAVQTLRYARTRKFAFHRAWAIRLVVLVMASWLYRLEYGLFGLLELSGRTTTFSGWFDQMMAFAFYVPNLVIAELYLRALRPNSSTLLRAAALVALVAAATVTATGVYSQW